MINSALSLGACPRRQCKRLRATSHVKVYEIGGVPRKHESKPSEVLDIDVSIFQLHRGGNTSYIFLQSVTTQQKPGASREPSRHKDSLVFTTPLIGRAIKISSMHVLFTFSL